MALSCPICGSQASPGDAVCRVCGSPLSPAGGGGAPPMALPPGTTLQGGQYVIRGVLGQGGFGITYDAQGERLGLRVALKELFVDGSVRRGRDVFVPGSLSLQDAQGLKNGFLEEAKVLARFNDPGIVRVLNYFEENGTAYLVMEFLEGETLGTAIEKRGPLPPLVAAHVADSAAHTLALVHGAGLLHRDIKPDNLFLEKSGRIVLIDFGSVRAFAPGKTVSHTRLVTPGYAPLEQYSSSAKYGPYTDIYALGATLYHALTGQMPPPATDLMLGTPLPPLPAQTPPNLREAVLRAMALRVEDRPQDARALQALLRGEGPKTPAPAPQTPAPQTAASQPRPTPAPPPRPAVREARRAPAPAPATAPAPMPRPVPQPVSQPPPPAPVVVRASPPGPPPPANRARARRTGRTLTVLSFLLGGGALGVLWASGSAAQDFPPGVVTPVTAGLVGAAAGAFAGALVWWAMPVMLPVIAALVAYLFAQQSGYFLPTALSVSVIAVILSLLFMRLIRRI